jgi:hypothetical protein
MTDDTLNMPEPQKYSENFGPGGSLISGSRSEDSCSFYSKGL